MRVQSDRFDVDHRHLAKGMASESVAFQNPGNDILVLDERAIVSRAAVVESKLAILRQRVELLLRRSKQ